MTEPTAPDGNQSTLSSDGLKRSIGVWGLSANIVNIMVGAGIFVLPAIVAAGLGSASLIAYLFCGFLIALIMLCFAEAGSEVTDSGGPYTYIESAFGKYAGFITANLFLIAALAADAAIVNAAADILAAFIPFLEVRLFRILFFLLIFGGFAWINVRGVRHGIGLVALMTIAKLTPLLLLVLIGWKEVTVLNLYWESIPSTNSIGQMSLILFFAFMGAEVGGRIFGPAGLTMITIGAVISMLGANNGGMLNMPRVLFAASRDGVIPPSALSNIHSQYTTPHVAIIVYATFAFLLASIGGFQALAIVSSAAFLLVYLGVVLAVIKLRKIVPAHSQSFRIPGGYTVPFAASIVILWFLSHLTGREATGILILIGVFTAVFFGKRFIEAKNAETIIESEPFSKPR